jgi:hypothetical protein
MMRVKLNSSRSPPESISATPDQRVLSERFHVAAKTPDDAEPGQMRLMLQTLSTSVERPKPD